MKNVGILATGCALPKQIVNNKDLEKVVKNYDPTLGKGSLDEWVQQRYGIKTRHWSSAAEAPSVLATQAAKEALTNAKLKGSDIDFIILNTTFGDYAQPTTATAVQRNLNMPKNSFALEINQPCSGPIYGLTLGYHFISSGRYKKGLIIGVDQMSDLIDKSDFKMAALFGEGAGACILAACQEGGILDYHLGSKGEEGKEEDYALVIPGGKAKHPASQHTVEKQMHYLYMRGKKVEQFIQQYILETWKTLVLKRNLTAADIDYVVSHQASKIAILKAMKQLNIPERKIQFTIEQYGNTSSASILITLHHLFKEKSVEAGQKIFIVGMGGGLNWGGILYESP